MGGGHKVRLCEGDNGGGATETSKAAVPFAIISAEVLNVPKGQKRLHRQFLGYSVIVVLQQPFKTCPCPQ